MEFTPLAKDVDGFELVHPLSEIHLPQKVETGPRLWVEELHAIKKKKRMTVDFWGECPFR